MNHALRSFFLLVFVLFICSIQSCTPKEEPVTYQQWHTVTLSFEGPSSSETAIDNPFLNYNLTVEFRNGDTQQTIRGFYAADGNASETSAEEGNIWQVRFTPEHTGEWTYTAHLHKGDRIAISADPTAGEPISISNREGKFIVLESDKQGEDFRAKGRLEAYKGYFKFRGTDQYWMKAGTNSPENLLAYVDFDGTYRTKAEARQGEAAAPENIHTFEPHLKDWKEGDAAWKNGKGKALIGAINYLSSKGMNSAYFLTMNIGGDGKDVWPFRSPDDFTRFDVSKLEQWEIVFQHMQSKGILLHMVLQETENETLFDDGDTGPMRQLYFRELIARFGHHLALVWNLGEENGPADWSPVGQNDRQRKDMSKYLKINDPYQHPVLLHTHSHDPLRSDILQDIVGYEYLDGLSLQQSEREETAHDIATWKAKAKATNHEWLITMDEIGKWWIGALPDSYSTNHDTLRHHVLWGTLLSGGAGIEWYFGAKYPHNDLVSEDWRQRDRLWEITNHAKEFFNQYLPYWEMEAQHELINSREGFCFRKMNEVYAIYIPRSGEHSIDLSEAKGSLTVQWYDPLKGGNLQNGSVTKLEGGTVQKIGKPPVNTTEQDWVVLVKK